ncbi:glycosyltransferase family 4 protein [Solitalea canadensis]|uniref:Glycosyltransferase n=1 Tax=Solitalea canadensis (strain ATCC 29591 / DSM 3403 / JCM 21819 / LMG 8368 / NBRC 15130 / NCIMB 12057 / USAM 9D) TaxID=929556 RepID=H8KNP9_SOLCM|nr:glycosyltransferase family 4 protein [Solitalea canadensis]AFD08182.1 glycosyltransferase [Solitalea canadensis DSM 3403]
MNSSRPKVCHISTIHQRYDSRIFYKECGSLSKAGYEVVLIVADGLGNETKNGIKIIDIGKPKSRFERFIMYAVRAYKTALAQDALIYHFHDPELLIIGYFLRNKKKIVVYDAHEDLPEQIKGKKYVPAIFRMPLSRVVNLLEIYFSKRMSGIVTATPFIRNKFLKFNSNSLDVNNFPILNGDIHSFDWQNKKNEVCYVGTIAEERGIKNIVKAMDKVDNAILNLVGEFESKQLYNETIEIDGWSKVNEHGFLNRTGVNSVLAVSKVGLVTLLPNKNYIEGLPVKMFEYMLAGIPVVASNFPAIEDVVKDKGCGICIDPLNPDEIASAVNYLLANDEEAIRMGANGQRSVIEKYNWTVEEGKLFGFYLGLTANSSL